MDFSQKVLQDFISDITSATRQNKFLKKPQNLTQLAFNYSSSCFDSERLKNLFEIIKILSQIELDEKQMGSILMKMEQFGVEEVGQLQFYGPGQLKQLGLDLEQIQKLRQCLQNSEIYEPEQQQQLTTQIPYFSNIQKTDTSTQEQENLRKSMKHLGLFNGFEVYQYPIFKKEEISDLQNFRTLIVLGETGTGKTTFINYFINFYHQVDLKDNFRYQLVSEDKTQSEAKSRTQNVTIYYIKPFQGKYGITIIDTPGILDTRGVGQDQQIIQQIQHCFKNQVDSLSTICFLIKSSTNRLTNCQNYILTSILQMFGKDIIQNFLFIFTFYEGTKEPQGINSLRFKGDKDQPPCPVHDLIDKINKPWYLPLNNVSMDSDRTNKITQIYWQLAYECFQNMYIFKIIQNKQQSLQLTRQVIDHRDQIAILVEQIRIQIKQQLDEIANIKAIQKHIQQLDSQIQEAKNFQVKQKQHSLKKVNIQQGTYTTNCIVCNHTCHYPCAYSRDDQKIKCIAMSDGKCKVCEGKCDWNQHLNMDYIVKFEEKEIIVELQELKQLYTSGIQTRDQKQKMIDKYEQKLTEIQASCMKKQVDLNKLLKQLREISLQPQVHIYQEGFADQMIKQEEQNQISGFQERIVALKEMKEFWKTIRETETNSGDSKITQQFLQDNLREWKRVNQKKYLL